MQLLNDRIDVLVTFVIRMSKVRFRHQKLIIFFLEDFFYAHYEFVYFLFISLNLCFDIRWEPIRIHFLAVYTEDPVILLYTFEKDILIAIRHMLNVAIHAPCLIECVVSLVLE